MAGDAQVDLNAEGVVTPPTPAPVVTPNVTPNVTPTATPTVNPINVNPILPLDPTADNTISPALNGNTATIYEEIYIHGLSVAPGSQVNILQSQIDWGNSEVYLADVTVTQLYKYGDWV